MKTAKPGPEEEVQARANAAVRAFTALLPGLTSYVRTLTGDPAARVSAGGTTSTDGSQIWIRPPLALGEPREHDALRCGERVAGVKTCPGCAAIERVYTALYHELGHILAGSNKTIRAQAALTRGRDLAAASATPEFIAWLDEAIAGMSPQTEASYLGIGTAVHATLVAVSRAIEDLRIERISFRARPGFETMTWHYHEHILDHGVELPNGKFDRWDDRTPDEQILIALLLQGHGHDLHGRLDDGIVRIVNSPRIMTLLQQELIDTADTIAVSVALLGELNKYGLFDLPIKSPPPPPPAGREEALAAHDNTEETESNDPGDDGSGGGGGGEPGDSGDRADDGQESDPGTDDDPARDQFDGDDDPGAAGASDDPAQGAAGGAATADDAGDEPAPDEAGVGDGDGAGGAGQSAAADEVDGADDADRHGGVGASADSAGDASPQLAPGGVAVDPRDDPGHPDGADDVAGDEGGAALDTGAGAVDLATDGPADLPEPDFRDAEHATDDELLKAIDAATGHEQIEYVLTGDVDESALTNAMEKAIRLAMAFDMTPAEVTDQKVFTDIDEEGALAWLHPWYGRRIYTPLPRATTAPLQAHARRVFSDSKMAKMVRNQRKGRLAAAKLGARAWNERDDRLFQKRLRPQGSSDFVVIGMDISGSVEGEEMLMMKRAIEAMADMLCAVGVGFAVYAHTTARPNYVARKRVTWEQHIYQVKSPNEAWTHVQRDRLIRLSDAWGSLDGHNLQFYRKVLARRSESRRTLIYFTDGRIPETNAVEELALVQDEIKKFSRLGYHILAIGVATDAPKEHGLDTICIDNTQDIGKILTELDARITTR